MSASKAKPAAASSSRVTLPRGNEPARPKKTGGKYWRKAVGLDPFNKGNR